MRFEDALCLLEGDLVSLVDRLSDWSNIEDLIDQLASGPDKKEAFRKLRIRYEQASALLSDTFLDLFRSFGFADIAPKSHRGMLWRHHVAAPLEFSSTALNVHVAFEMPSAGRPASLRVQIDARGGGSSGTSSGSTLVVVDARSADPMTLPKAVKADASELKRAALEAVSARKGGGYS